ncbi:aldo/keto reductase [Mucisphaera calidilacus]|uniref:Pyridoxal 4-dehydrogenase n=1 Tax=Mucisphaera calidilacus TaxID=2527982 RepID=A0A518C0A6_9BACT|nr:aldo/keto reductase [Mucisphaera calidilacus]QDU72661.1 Pyridoxal 4-dehydrogenase [Mucisphaera calidilacus]
MSHDSRRDFLKKAALGGALAAGLTQGRSARADDQPDRRVVPRTTLGKTGREVSILGLGLGSAYTRPYENDPETAQALLEAALDHGINYFDTARAYGPSEQMIAPVVKAHRDRIYLVSKSGARDYDGLMREFEITTTNLGVDRLDLYHLHNLKPGQDDLGRMERGCLRAIRELREQGAIGHFGVTGHSGAQIMTDAIERFDPDAVLTIFPVSRPDQGRYETQTLAVARQKKMGVIAMKIFRRAREADLQASKMVSYALSLPGVHTAIIGLDRLDHLIDNVNTVTNLEPMDEAERDELHRIAKARLGNDPAPYELAGYRDAHDVA